MNKIYLVISDVMNTRKGCDDFSAYIFFIRRVMSYLFLKALSDGNLLPTVFSPCQILPNTVEERQSDRVSTVPSPFLDLDAPKSAWIYHKMAASLPFTDRVFRPFPILSPFPLPFPHRVALATAVLSHR